ncbi:hypothetical protein ACM40_16025 [Chryseobacterium sp. BLS98]|jgi:hypothetical protein|uniref:hypothetical protein n=1 Tax=Chryseobacterium sp. BLS98 TaxID=885586 RepID=UPI00065AD706|nr:hypothetical protein [Chryseobacterium sp. BLS98]KMQ59639.1 hypothetical protein ACM40_16025 [Chryseobacterium sp. BLS98]
MIRLVLKNLLITGIITFTLAIVNNDNIVMLIWLRSWMVALTISLFFNVVVFSNSKNRIIGYKNNKQ